MTQGEQKLRVLVVDDDPVVAQSLAEFMREENLEPTTAHSAAEALQALREAEVDHADRPGVPFALAVCDVALPGTGGIELLRSIIKEHPGVAVVMLTGYGTVESAVESLRHGAIDFLSKPAADRELRVSLGRAIRHHTLIAENLSLRKKLDDRYSLQTIAGTDTRMLKIFDLVRAVAPSRTTVLMCGESGTGKSLIAHAIHNLSPRRERAFVELSCGSIPETLLESELFGHVKGAFTGAHTDKPGRFLAANGGTIFLDEINSASPAMQLKLLRVLQERKFEPVGSNQTVEVDVRVVLASNQPLERLVAEGQFRQDLFYRINVVQVELPPLRDRPGDVPLLATRFLARYAMELGKQIVGFSDEAMALLTRYAYPGNVRELQNIVERAAVLCHGQTVQASDLPTGVALAQSHVPTVSGEGDDSLPWKPMLLEEAMKDPERRILLRALKANAWNRQKTAEQLGINRTTLYKKLKVLGIEPGDERMAG
ncbi:MAG: sigma-54 dependent transcriptional regulator [Planctomycetota bacterium]